MKKADVLAWMQGVRVIQRSFQLARSWKRTTFNCQNSLLIEKQEAGVAFAFVRLTAGVSRKWVGRDSA
jgi:hypothetical protein